MSDIEQKDDETERLLAELAAQEQAETEQAEAEQAETEQAETKQAKAKSSKKKSSKKQIKRSEPVDMVLNVGDILTNTSKNPHRIKGETIKVEGTYTLSDIDLADDRLMAKINHAVNLGVLSCGAD